LLTSGKLAEHLHEIDTVAQEMLDNIIQQMAEEAVRYSGTLAQNRRKNPRRGARRRPERRLK